jgi:hypothetical protein
MQLTLSLEKVLPPGWPEILEEIRQRLARAAEAEEERERQLNGVSAGEGPPLDRNPEWCLGWQRLEERLRAIQAGLDGAGQVTAEADAVLSAGAEAIEGWLTATQAARRKLADRAGCEV